jgi:hypothetical protein
LKSVDAVECEDEQRQLSTFVEAMERITLVPGTSDCDPPTVLFGVEFHVKEIFYQRSDGHIIRAAGNNGEETLLGSV